MQNQITPQLNTEIQKLKEQDYTTYQKFYAETSSYLYGIIWNTVQDNDVTNSLIEELYNDIYKTIAIELRDNTTFYEWAGNKAQNLSNTYVATHVASGNVSSEEEANNYDKEAATMAVANTSGLGTGTAKSLSGEVTAGISGEVGMSEATGGFGEVGMSGATGGFGEVGMSEATGGFGEVGMSGATGGFGQVGMGEITGAMKKAGLSVGAKTAIAIAATVAVIGGGAAIYVMANNKQKEDKTTTEVTTENMMYATTEADTEDWAEEWTEEITEEPIEEIQLVEISEEIKNASMLDEVFQVYNAVLKTDGSMTVREVYEAVQAGTDFNVTINADENKTVTGYDITYYNIKDDEGEIVCFIEACNDVNLECNSFDQKVINVKSGWGMHLYNCILPSGIIKCYGINIFADDEEKAICQTRIEEMGGEVLFEDMVTFASEHGAPYLETGGDLWRYAECSTQPVAITDEGEELYKCVFIEFSESGTTGNMCVFDGPYVSLGKKGEKISTMHRCIPYPSTLSDETIQLLVADVTENAKKDFIYGSQVGELEFVKIVEYEYSNGDADHYMILRNSDGRYMAPQIAIYLSYGGNPSGHYVSWYGGLQDSVEEAMDAKGLTDCKENMKK